MDYITDFLEASKMTQNIILGVNLFFLIYYLIGISIENKIAVYGSAILAIGLLYIPVKYYSPLDFKTYFIYYHITAIIAAIILYILFKIIQSFIPEKALGVFDVKIETKSGVSIIVNIIKGVSVQGAAGSGKTLSIASWILFWMGKRSVPGLIYDYKNFELVELVLWFYRDSEIPVNNFSPAEPNKSVMINPLDPKILEKQEDILLMGKCIVKAVFNSKDTGSSFFTEAAEGAIIGVIIKLKEDYPQFCSFSYLVAVFLDKDVEQLVAFIESNKNASRQARAFLDGADSAKQMAGVKASLSNAFRMFDVPNILYTMQRNHINLALNDKKDMSVLCMVNKPKYGDIYEPIFTIVSQAVILQMSERNREPSYILLDEAPTLRIPDIQRVPATMRSFGIATIYMLQDKVQAVNRLSLNIMKEIFSNLSSIFFGKTNDPDTAKFYESYFEDIKVKQKSVSKKNVSFFESGGASTTTSEKDEKKHKSYEMFKRKTGQFFVFDDKGQSFDAQIKMPKIEIEPIKESNSVTEWEVQRAYEEIFRTVSKI